MQKQNKVDGMRYLAFVDSNKMLGEYYGQVVTQMAKDLLSAYLALGVQQILAYGSYGSHP